MYRYIDIYIYIDRERNQQANRKDNWVSLFLSKKVKKKKERGLFGVVHSGKKAVREKTERKYNGGQWQIFSIGFFRTIEILTHLYAHFIFFRVTVKNTSKLFYFIELCI